MAVWDDYNWDFWNPNEEPLPESTEKQYKISLCTTCMGRLHDLKSTLIQNMIDNADYSNAEFVILDYNSNDGLGAWVKENMMGYIESGRLVYARTEEPQYFEMGHSRNIAFKVASGDIVNNVDADNFTKAGFMTHLNKMANLCPEKAVFSKGKRMLRGRIGFYKNEFLELGGYDEDLTGYGFDDHNVMYRAMALGYKLMWYGGQYVGRIKTSKNMSVENMKNKKWKQTEDINKDITFKKLENKQFIVNQDRHWGKANLIKNFTEEISV